MTIDSVAALIEAHEGRRDKLYRDSLGRWTVGVGRCLETKPLRDFEIDFLRDNDIRDADKSAIAIFGAQGFATMAAARQAVLVDMAFQLGEAGLRKFSHMIAAIEAGDWETAAAEALASGWAAQTPVRAKMNAGILRTGNWPS